MRWRATDEAGLDTEMEERTALAGGGHSRSGCGGGGGGGDRLAYVLVGPSTYTHKTVSRARSYSRNLL